MEMMTQEKKGADLRPDSLATAVGELRTEVRVRFAEIDKRFEQVDKRFEQVDKRFEQVDARFSELNGSLMSLHRLLIRVSIGGAVAVSISLIGIVVQLVITLGNY